MPDARHTMPGFLLASPYKRSLFLALHYDLFANFELLRRLFSFFCVFFAIVNFPLHRHSLQNRAVVLPPFASLALSATHHSSTFCLVHPEQHQSERLADPLHFLTRLALE